MIASSATLLIHPLTLILTAASLNVYHGFTTPTLNRLTLPFYRKLPTLQFQEDDTLVEAAPEDLVTSLLNGKAMPLLEADLAAAVDATIQDEDPAVTSLPEPAHRFEEDTTHVPSTMHKLDYEEIHSIIDVSEPYYKLAGEIQVDTPEDVIGSENESLGTAMRHGLVCTVDPEMPMGREGGSPVSCAEAGRHMAIAGSVAAALNQPSKRKGKFYYLAMSCVFEGAADAVDASAHVQLCSTAGLHVEQQDKCVISALCCELTNRKAVCNIMMHFPKNYGFSKPFYLRVEYSVLSPKLFGKFYPPLCLDQQEMINHHQTSSPYADFIGLPKDSFDILSQSDTYVKLSNSSIKKVPAEMCQGHFDGNPAFPIAFMSAYCADLCGEAISALTGKAIHFETALPGHALKHDGHVLRFLSGTVDAQKLVQAESCGVVLSCEVSTDKTDDSSDIFSCYVSIHSLEPEGHVSVAKLQCNYELLSV